MNAEYSLLPTSNTGRQDRQQLPGNRRRQILLAIALGASVLSMIRIGQTLLLSEGRVNSVQGPLNGTELNVESPNISLSSNLTIDPALPTVTTPFTTTLSQSEVPLESTASAEELSFDPSDDRFRYGSYKTNISPDVQYFTYLPMGGTNNQLIALFHALQMTTLLNRTIIIPPIGPNLHINVWSGPPYSQFYDLERFSQETGIKLVEWHKVKPAAANLVPPKVVEDDWTRFAEPMGCYIRSRMKPAKTGHRVTDRLRRQMLLNVKFDYFPADYTHGVTAQLPEFVEIFSQASDHLLCVSDSYTLSTKEGEIWDTIGSHLRYSSAFEAIVDDYLYRLLPPNTTEFIGIHLRRGDIKVKCGFDKDASIEEWRDSACFVKLETLEQRISEILADKNWDPSMPVLIATNEVDRSELTRIKKLGWILIDHRALRTVEKYGLFHPAMLDAAILVRSKWFLGSQRSAMSKFVASRAKSWHENGFNML